MQGGMPAGGAPMPAQPGMGGGMGDGITDDMLRQAIINPRTRGPAIQILQQRQAQAQQQAEEGRILEARAAALRQAGMPDELIGQVVYDENATRMALEAYQQRQADQRHQQFADSVRGGSAPMLPSQAAPAPADIARGVEPPPRQDMPRPGTPEADARISDLDAQITAERDRIESIRQQFEQIANQADERTKATMNNAIAESERRIGELAEQRNGLMPEELSFTEARPIYENFERETEPHAEAFRRFDQMAEIVTRATGTADRELIRVLDRMFDPNLRRPVSGDDDVRGTSALDRGLNYIQMLEAGTQLTPNLRAEIMQAARDYLDVYVNDYQDIAEGTRDRVSYFFPNADVDRSVLGRRNQQFERIMRRLEGDADPPPADPTLDDVEAELRRRGIEP